MEKPIVGVLDVSQADLDNLKWGKSKVNLGGGQNVEAAIREAAMNGLLDRLKKSSEKATVFNWKGGKIPRGAMINGQEIGWIQNGVVTSVDGKRLGTYDRLVEFGGTDHDEQCIVVFKI